MNVETTLHLPSWNHSFVCIKKSALFSVDSYMRNCVEMESEILIFLLIRFRYIKICSISKIRETYSFRTLRFLIFSYSPSIFYSDVLLYSYSSRSSHLTALLLSQCNTRSLPKVCSFEQDSAVSSISLLSRQSLILLLPPRVDHSVCQLRSFPPHFLSPRNH